MDAVAGLGMTPEERLIYRACGSKVRYDTPGPARKAVKRSKLPHLNAYRCKHCHGWHVGTAIGLTKR